MGVLLAIAVVFNGYIPDLEILRGDANNDTTINTSDPVYISSFLYQGGNAPPCKDAADVNDDGSLDNSDVIYLYQFLFMGGSPPASPYPYCDLDTTSDDLDCLNSACS